MYDEERDEENRDFHRPTRDHFHPDGRSAPPDCEHPKLRPIPGTLDMSICTSCGMFLRAGKPLP